MGKIYKIRLELIPKSVTVDPSWKVREVKMLDLNSKEQLRFQFNRWLSRQQEDGEIMRELPAIRPGQEVLPGRKIYSGKKQKSRKTLPLIMFT